MLVSANEMVLGRHDFLISTARFEMGRIFALLIREI